MDARELADKFSAKVAAAATELHHQETVATDSAKSRLDDVVHIKRAMEQQVIPFLKELEHHFGAKQFSFAPQVDIDHKPVGVSFRIGDGAPTMPRRPACRQPRRRRSAARPPRGGRRP